MGITLFTAPDCLRCKIVKSYLAEKNIAYDTIDYKAQKDEFNTFYRTNRPSIYRNPEGVEFPLFYDGEVIKQGSGETIAYLLSGHALEACVTRSDLLHGWISGLYPSQCPDGQEDNFVELVRHLANGGLQVYLQADGRKPELLERLLKAGNIAKLSLNILGPAEVYASSFGGPVSKEELSKSIELVRAFPKGEIRLLVSPTKRADGSWTWTSKEEAAEAAKMVAEASGDQQLPFVISAVTEEMPQGLQGLEPFSQSLMLPYRSACRNHLFKTDIAKPA